MNENLVEVPLDPKALEFIRESLANAMGSSRWLPKEEELADGSVAKTWIRADVREDSLAHRLMKREDLGRGAVTTCVPEDVPEDLLYEFREGGKLEVDPASLVYQKSGRMEPVPNTNKWLVAVLQEYLRGDRYRVCVFEASLSSPKDESIARSGLKPYTFANVVYFALVNRDAEDAEKIETTIRRTSNVWLFYGVMSSLPRGASLDPEGGPISQELLEVLAKRAEKIVVGAYDGESYLIWSRPAESDER